MGDSGFINMDIEDMVYGEVRMSMLKKLFLLHRKSSLLGLNQKVDSELSNSDPTMMLCRRNPYTKCIIELIPHG
jgi:hypothetical protein